MNMKMIQWMRDKHLLRIRLLISRTPHWSLDKPIRKTAAVSMVRRSGKLITQPCRNLLILALITMLIKTTRIRILLRKKAEPTTTVNSWLIGQPLPEEPVLTIKTHFSAPCSTKIDKPAALSELQAKDKKPWSTLQPSRAASNTSLHSTEFKHQIALWCAFKMMNNKLIAS